MTKQALKAAARRVSVEGLEARNLFAATGGISGYLFHDFDADNYRDYDDTVSSTHAVFIDLDNNGTADTGEPVAYATSAGYQFNALENGTYTVRLLAAEMGAGEFSTVPNGAKSVVVQYGWISSGTDLGYATNGGITGHTYQETSSTSTSFSTSDTVITGRTVYVDLDNDGVLDTSEPSAVTPASGKGYVISGLKPGTYTLRQVLPDGWYSTSSTSTVSVRSGQNITANAGSKPLDAGKGAIEARLFFDYNGDGVRDAVDTAQSGYTSYLFLDLNDNGVRDGSDLSPSMTFGDGAAFINLQPGTYKMRFDYSGSYILSPGADPSVVVTADQVTSAYVPITYKTVTLYGDVYNDLDGDGIKGTSETSSLADSVRVYVDLNGNQLFDSVEPYTSLYSGSFYLYSVPVGTYEVRLELPANYVMTSRTSTLATGNTFASAGVVRVPQDLVFTTSTSSSTSRLNFGLHKKASISGKVYNDLNRNGTVSSGEVGIADRVVYIDADNDAIFDEGETSVLTNATGDYSFPGLAAGTYTIRAQYPAGWTQSSPIGNAAIVSILTTGQQLTGKNYLQYEIPTKGGISGLVRDDRNGDGSVSSDPGVAGITVFLDHDNDSILDTDEPFRLTGANGDFLFSDLVPVNTVLRVLVPTTHHATTTTFQPIVVIAGNAIAAPTFGVFKYATHRGAIYNDLNGDRLRQSWEPGLAGVSITLKFNNAFGPSMADLTMFTDANGEYEITGLPAGAPRFTIARPDGFVLTGSDSATSQVGYSEVTSGYTNDSRATLPLAMTSKSVITGWSYQQTSYGSTRVLPGTIVYIDDNGNDKRDAGEKFATAHANGIYYLGGLVAGTYTVRFDLHADATPVNAADMERIVTVDGLRYKSQPATYFFSATGNVAYMTRAGEVNEGGVKVLDVNEYYSDAFVEKQWDLDYSPQTGFQVDSVLGNPTYDSLGRDSALRHMVAVRYADSLGNFGPVAAFAIDIYNIAPTAVLSGVSMPAFEGAGVSFGSIIEPSAADLAALKYSYDFNNDGTFDLIDSSLATASLPAAMGNTPGTYTVRARIADKDGGFNDYTTTVTVTAATVPQAMTIQAETGTFTGGTGKSTSNAGYTGTGYADFGGNTSAAQWTITRPMAYGHSLEFRYANGGTANRPLQVFVNGTLAGTIACAPTGGWTKWSTVSLSSVQLPAGNVTIRAVASTTAGGGNVDSITINPTNVTPPPPPPPTETLGSIRGLTFNDNDADGVFETTDSRAGGKTVYIDANNNGKLDTGEKNVKSATDGTFAFTGLSAGTYRVRRVFPSGYTYSNAPLDIVLTAGQNVTNANIGSKSGTAPATVALTLPPPPQTTTEPAATTGSIGGAIFWDSNKNGLFDTGEAYQAGKVVFIDLDGDNVLDSNEKKLTTDANGKFNFTGLAAGTYKVRRVVPSGYKMTTPAQDITITAGQIFSTVAIGTINA